MRDLVLTAFVLGTIPFIFYRPYIGVAVWAWLSYMTPFRYTWSFAYDFRFAYIIAAVTLVAWFLSREPKRIVWSGATTFLVAFWIWSTVTLQFAEFPAPAKAQWVEMTKIVLMDGIVTMALFTTRLRLDVLIWVIVASIGFFGVKGGIFTILSGGDYRIGGAPGTYFGENNFLAAALVITVPLMRYLQLQYHHRVVRWGLTAVMILSVFAVLGSQSRGGLVGLLALVLVLFARSRKKLLLSFGLIAALGVGFLFMPESWHARMATILDYQEDASVEGRFEAWRYGFEKALEKPLVGGGYEAFLGYERAAHSIYFQTLGEHGFVGFAFYVLFLATVFLTAGAVARRAKGRADLTWAQDLMRMVQSSLIVFACVGAFLSLAYFELIVHLGAVAVATRGIVRQAVAAPAPDAPPRVPEAMAAAADRGSGA
jgi:probable O-glycosylation ligase (exosortase A-associated)